MVYGDDMDGDVTIRETADLLNATVAFVRGGSDRPRRIDGHTLLNSEEVKYSSSRLKIANDLSAEARQLGLDY